jgi:hypothetical protein
MADKTARDGWMFLTHEEDLRRVLTKDDIFKARRYRAMAVGEKQGAEASAAKDVRLAGANVTPFRSRNGAFLAKKL